MDKNYKILIAEDDENLGTLLKEYLAVKGYKTNLLLDGESAYESFLDNKYDVCILDIMMPRMDGFSLAKEIRKMDSRIPIIFLTAKSMKEDIVRGFKIGGDDYITKPFSMEELLSRIEAVLRRTKNGFIERDVFYLGKYKFEVRKHQLVSDDSVIKLTTKETDLLKLLCNNANKILERNFALKVVWADDSFFSARCMDVYITKLRKIIKDEPSVEILNVHGKGYKLVF